METSTSSSSDSLPAVPIHTKEEASASYDPDRTIREALAEMFPGVDSQVIEEAAHDSLELHDAIDFVLNRNQGKTGKFYIRHWGGGERGEGGAELVYPSPCWVDCTAN